MSLQCPPNIEPGCLQCLTGINNLVSDQFGRTVLKVLYYV